MSGDLKTLSTAFECILNARPWLTDIGVLELPWKQEMLDSVRRRACRPGDHNGKLVFGLMETDNTVNPQPAIQRGLGVVKQALEDCGYEVKLLLLVSFHKR